VIRRLSGSKRNEVTGRWKILYKEELHNLWSSQNKIRNINSMRIRTAEHVACMEKTRNVCTFFNWKPEEKRSL
jgi:hypothetical protein